MNLRRKAPADSLYLLLDTLCNAFGSIVLLAVLVVLLTSKEKSRRPAAAESVEMVQRRLAVAQTNLQASLALAASLKTRADRGESQQLLALLSTRKDLEEAIRQTRDSVVQKKADLDSANAVDPAERLKFLQAQMAQAQARRLEVQSQLDRDTEEIQRLRLRARDLDRQVAVKVKDTQRPLRLPKEHETSKSVEYIIVDYGRIFPCVNCDLTQNDVDIEWTMGFLGDLAKPIPGKGVDPDKMVPFFDCLSDKGVYVVFCVYEDSFPAFIRVRELAVADGISYGWEPFNKPEGILFGQGGQTPKPQ